MSQKHLEDPVPKDRLQLLQVQGRSDPEHAPVVEVSIRHQDMAVGVESEEVAKGLDGADSAGEGIPLRHRLPKKNFSLDLSIKNGTLKRYTRSRRIPY